MLFPGMYFLVPQCHSLGWGEGQAGSLILSTTCPAGCPSRDGNKARCPPASSQGRLLLKDWWPPGEEKLHCSSPPPASSQFLLPLIQFSYPWPQQTVVPELLSMNSTNYWGVKIETFEFWEQTQRCRLKRTEKKGWEEERRSLDRERDNSQAIRSPAKDESTESISQNEHTGPRWRPWYTRVCGQKPQGIGQSQQKKTNRKLWDLQYQGPLDIKLDRNTRNLILATEQNMEKEEHQVHQLGLDRLSAVNVNSVLT